MKLTNEQIITFMNLDFTEKKLPIKLGFALSVNHAQCEPFVKQYEEKYNEIIKLYAEKDDDGKIVILDENNGIPIVDPQAFSSEVNDLLSMQIEIPITMVPVEHLEKCDLEMFDSLSVAEISSIAFMIEE